MKFLVDENLTSDLTEAIVRLDPAVDVLRVGDNGAPATGTLDPEILQYCEAQQRALVTNNRASMARHERDHFAAGRHHWGIFRLRPGFGIGPYARGIYLLWSASEAKEWDDVKEWIPWS